jgi:hypothetical protein
MLRRFSDLRGFTIAATDGDIGSVEDLYFDDESWTVRHLVVDTGRWLSGRKVLISPASVERVDPVRRAFATRLTRAQVEGSPHVDTARPVSRQQESVLSRYYGAPMYWTGPLRWGAAPYPPMAPTAAGLPGSVGGVPRPPAVVEELAARERESADPHLRSARAVTGYGLRATDGDLGHVEDFLVDETDWAIRYLVADPRSWWPGPHVLLSTEWIRGVDWDDRVVELDVDREAVRGAPAYETSRDVDRHWESRLHAHYRRPGYWERDPGLWRLRPPAA